MAQNANTEAEAQAEAITQGEAHNENVAAADQTAAIVQGVVNVENSAAAIVALSALQRVLHIIVGLTRTKCVAVADYGYEDFMVFEDMQWDSTKKWISAARKSNLNRGGLSISSTKEKRIQALALWVNDSLRIGRVKNESEFDETEFTTIKMTEMVDKAYIHYLDRKTGSDVSTPEKLSNKKWEIWEEAVRNWIHTKILVSSLSLPYVIHKDTTPLTMDHYELIIYNYSLTTAIFKAGRRKVANILTPLVLDTDSFEWGGRNFTKSNGREGLLNLVSH